MRLSKDEYFMEIAKTVAKQSTCKRRSVGCVIVDAKGHILSTGYNGLPSGYVHCVDNACLGAYARSGERLNDCLAIHAEQNALLQCEDIQSIQKIYCTTMPCSTCLKMILNTPVEEVIYEQHYDESVQTLKELQKRVEFDNKYVKFYKLIS